MDLFDLDEASKASDNKKRIKELEKLIVRYQKSYYDGEGEISDAEFDKLWDELKSLDPQNPVLQKVGADSGNFEKAMHIMPMGSQEKAATPEQFLDWASKHVYPEYLVEYKLDGASLELQYEKGILVKAVTRGDGTVGDDITANAKVMQGVQAALYINGKSVDFTGGIRGEVIMSHDVHNKYFSDKANCRNAANGLMKRKGASGCEHLKLITYDALATEGLVSGTNQTVAALDKQPFNDEESKIKWLSSLGFFTSPLQICKTPEDVIDYRAHVMEIRKDLEYDIDGLVIKERVINFEDARRNRPDHQIAFKFSLEEAISIVRDVEWSESGATYTPVAIFDTVELAGTKVQRASLANPDTLRTLGVKIGSHVVVVKRGEIIPKIERVVSEESDAVKSPSTAIVTTPIVFPKTCSVCGTLLADIGSRLYCPNKDCKKRILHRIFKWIECIDIRDFGDALVNSLFKDGVIKSVKDIYSLTEEKLVPYFVGEESQQKVSKGEKVSLGAQKVYNSIQSHRNVRLSSFIAGFDIEGIGETMVDKLIEAGFNSLEKMLAASADDFAAVYMFADVTARTLKDGLTENEKEMRSLVESGDIRIEEITEGKLTGKSFCFTGELHSMKRQDAELLVKQNGGAAKSSVTKDLTYLVTNDKESGSSKNVKAQKLGIAIINEEEFLQLVK
ncbi:NAD-dependent DNA ligase LigA [Treponema sp.]|uniref:NAD-dependent DNA ligase LigA n=1 Tax=Treponema sp. TaxID=166 RepID=UPI00298E44D9|nr:NAD-dependent DNA ligase LigA [Treponema sp.]MCR5612982.1 NAD-dependent DNA ligase LigA [Treponema sp.]